MLIRPLGWEDPLEKEMATHSSVLPGKSHGQRSLSGYSPRGRKESDTTHSMLVSIRKAQHVEPKGLLVVEMEAAGTPAPDSVSWSCLGELRMPGDLLHGPLRALVHLPLHREDRASNDLPSITQLVPEQSQGGSALSPAAVIRPERARQQAAALAKEVGCPSSSVQEMVSCLRQEPANILNDAQTKLLAVSGPFHYWGPVVDGQYLREAPARALQRAPRAKVDLLIGSSQDDGLINRAKAVKQFEESQGRTSSKTAFYQALQNSLGGEAADAGVQAAATWYYSLDHDSDDYASFSRALEQATRDYFIICPVIDMASHWARTVRGNVFMYHAPESYSHSSLELLTDVLYAFGVPFYPAYEGQFTLEEKSLSLKIMQYFSNFIRSGNPNYPHEFTRRAPEFAAPWPDFVPRDGAESYKELSVLLPNRQGLKKADCSFWSKYIQSLKTSADEAKDGSSAESEEEVQLAGSGLTEDLLGLPELASKTYSK